MQKNKDSELIKRILAKDEKVIVELRKKYFPMIKYMVMNYKYSDGTNISTGNFDDAEDILHDTFYIIIKKIFNKKLSLTSKLSTYFYAVSKNLLKVKLNKRLHEIRYRKYNENEIFSYEKTDKFFDNNLKKNAFEYYFSKLSKGCTEILKLYWLEYSVAETAEKLGNTKNYIMKRKYECQKKLIKLIKENKDNY